MIYLKLTMSPIEIVDTKIQGLLPRKLNKHKATILSVETDEKEERGWYPTPISFLTQENKRKIVRCLLEQMTKLIFSTHLYEWQGQIYLQPTGGPTGIRSVGPISRCLMDKWIEFILKISLESLELHWINPVRFT